MSQPNVPPELTAATELVQNAGGRVHFPRRSVEIWGQAYPSIKAVVQDPRCEVGYLTLLKRVAAGVDISEAVKKSLNARGCKPIVCWGESFPAVKFVALDPRCEVSYSVLLTKLKKGMAPDDAVKDSRFRKPITTINQAIVG